MCGSFPFLIVQMPYLSSNMSSRIVFASLGAQVLRLARATTDSNNFPSSFGALFSRFVN